MKKVLIVLPNVSYPLIQLQSGLLTALEFYANLYNFSPYQYGIVMIRDDDDLETLMPVGIRLAQERYDVIFTIGSKCTAIMKTLCARMRVSTPLVFGGVLDPAYVIPATHAIVHQPITGVRSEPLRYADQLKILFALVKQIRKVLILQSRVAVYGNERLAGSQLINLLAKQGIEGQEVVIDDMQTFGSTINPYLEGADLIIMLRRNIFMSHIDHIAQLCCERRIPLYACDLSSVRKGAALGFGDFDYNIGVEVVKKALPFIVGGRHGCAEPAISYMPWDEKVMVNISLARQQQLVIAPSSLEGLTRVNFV